MDKSPFWPELLYIVIQILVIKTYYGFDPEFNFVFELSIVFI